MLTSFKKLSRPGLFGLFVLLLCFGSLSVMANDDNVAEDTGGITFPGTRVLPDETTQQITLTRSSTTTNTGIGISLSGIDAQNFPFVYMNALVDAPKGVALPVLAQEDFCLTEDGVSQTDYFEVVPPGEGGGIRLADIVFLMDNSGSMSDEQNAVARGVFDLVNGLDNAKVDYALGLTRYGQSASGGNPILVDSGNLTSDASYFRNSIWKQNTVRGGHEPGYRGIVDTLKGFNFRTGSQKIVVIITDETPDQDRVRALDALSAINAADATIFAITYRELYKYYNPLVKSDAQKIDITGNFSAILDFIVQQVSRTYVIKYRTSNDVMDGVERFIEVCANYQNHQGIGQGKYTPGAAPSIDLTSDTQALLSVEVAQNSEIKISTLVRDSVEPLVQEVKLFYKSAQANSYNYLLMQAKGNDLFEASIPTAAVLEPGVDFYLQAYDGGATSSLPTVNPGANPYQIAVLPNYPPQISHQPIKMANAGQDLNISAVITDTTNFIQTAEVRIRKLGALTYQKIPLANQGNDVYSALLTGDKIGQGGSEYYLVAVDDYGISTLFGSADKPMIIKPNKAPEIRQINIGGEEEKTSGQKEQPFTEGSPIHFDADFKDDNPEEGHTFHWDFGDGTTDTSGSKVSHIYHDHGSYTVILTITDDGGNSDSLQIEVIIENVPPKVRLKMETVSVIQGNAVQFAGEFIDAGANDVHTITWDFGDGTTLTGELNPTHIYQNYGDFTVTFSVVDETGAGDSTTIIIHVEPMADFRFTSQPTVVIADGLTYTYNIQTDCSDCSLEATVLPDWLTLIDTCMDMGDLGTGDLGTGDTGLGDLGSDLGNIGTELTNCGGTLSGSAFISEGNGSYPVELSLTDGEATLKQSFVIEVKGIPTFDAFGGDFELDLTKGTDFVYNIVSGLPDGAVLDSSTGQLAMPPMTPPGDYQVVVEVVDYFGDVKQETVTVVVSNTKPTATAASYNVEQGNSVEILLQGKDVDAGQSLTYVVTGNPTNGQLTGSGSQLVYVANSGFSGQDSFVYVVNDGVEDSEPTTVDLNVTEVNTTPVAATAELTLNVNGSGAGHIKADLTGMTCATSCTTAYTTGVSVELSAISTADSEFIRWLGACSGTSACVINMNQNLWVSAEFAPKPNEAPQVTGQASYSAVEGQALQLSATVIDANATDKHKVYWNFGDGQTATGTLNPTHTWNDNGSYEVTLTVTDGNGGKATSSIQVEIENSNPSVEIGQDKVCQLGDTLSFLAQGMDDGQNDTLTYEWYFGDGSTAVGNAPSHQFSAPGTYNVEVIVIDDDGGIGSDFLNVEVQPSVVGSQQIVSVDAREESIVIGESFAITVNYHTSDNNPNTTGLGLRIHFDSNMLTWLNFSDLLEKDQLQLDVQPQADTEDYDLDANTDSYLTVAWAGLNGQSWPGVIPEILYRAHFKLSETLTAGETTKIRFSGFPASGYELASDVVNITATEPVLFNLDVDGNGKTDPLTDGLLAIRYLFGFTGETLTKGALAQDASRNAQEIESYLSNALCPQSCILDIDGSNTTEPLEDGLLVLRYLFGFSGETLTKGIVGANATRTDAASIEAYLLSLMP